MTDDDPGDVITAILTGEYPDRRVASITPARYGNTKRTAVVEFEDGDSVVVQRSSDVAGHRTEVALTREIARRTDVPVPSVHASGTREGASYAVLERVPGADLHERFAGLPAETRRALARRFGGILATLHDAFGFEAFGPVVVEPPATDGPVVTESPGTEGTSVTESGPTDTSATLRATGPDDWRTWFEGYAREGVEALPTAFDDLRDPIHTAVETDSLPASPSARLYPWDLRPGNALVDGGDLTAVLDWGDPLAAAPGLAAAKTEHLVADWYVENPEPLRCAFREGYRERRPLPEIPRAYRLVAVVRSAVDARGEVTRPRYPEREGEAAVAFHRERIERLL